MEATVNINVKVSLEEATIQGIREILVPRPAGIEARPAQGPRPAVPEKPQAMAPASVERMPRAMRPWSCSVMLPPPRFHAGKA